MRKSGVKKQQAPFKTSDYQRQGITADEVQQIKEAFDLFDTQLSGYVEPKQLKNALNSLGFEGKNQTLYQMICDLEDEGSGPIDFGQFFQLMTARVSQKDTRESIHKLFNLFDDEKAGYISIKNLRKVVKDLGQNIDEADLQEMIDRADLDKDGLVSEDEFYCIMTKKSIR